MARIPLFVDEINIIFFIARTLRTPHIFFFLRFGSAICYSFFVCVIFIGRFQISMFIIDICFSFIRLAHIYSPCGELTENNQRLRIDSIRWHKKEMTIGSFSRYRRARLIEFNLIYSI